MTTPDRKFPRIVSRSEWLDARRRTKNEEESFGCERKDLIAKWRGLPMVEIDKDHVFEGPNGKVSLIDLFEGRRQLLVYHFWFQPGEEPCEGCSLWTYDLGDLGGNFASLHKYDTTLAFVSRASSAEMEGVKKRRHWTMPWYSIVGDDFDDATGYAGWAQISIFARDGEAAYLANVVPFDDLKNIGNHWNLLERTPFDVGN
jgi:predicted dithiol-disulfide oxidoreductase (DUF899 family)